MTLLPPVRPARTAPMKRSNRRTNAQGISQQPDPIARRPLSPRPRPPMGRVRVDGKQLAVGSERFALRGVTYGTFEPRDDLAAFPRTSVIRDDFQQMAAVGFNVVRTYTAPPADLIEAASDAGLRLFPEAFSPDWRYLLNASRRECHRVARTMREQIRTTVRSFDGAAEIAALSVGNEVPADVIRWFGAKNVERLLASLVDTAHQQDPDLLVTYANYPTSEYLHVDGTDFVTFNLYLEDRQQLRRYLTRLQNLAGDQPLVLGEIGLSASDRADGDAAQAEVLDWQLSTALERGVAGTCLFSWTDDWWVGGQQVEGWKFGLTRHDRSPRPALEVAKRWNARTVRDLDHDWPTMSVVVCAYNADATLDECLTHLCRLDYPGLEILVVDDGSTDHTALIAAAHAAANSHLRLVEIPHAGLSVARNEGARVARGDLVAYLDADAFPTPEWPYYLALGLDGPTVGGVGGPNVPPPGDGPGATQVAASPGGPVHVLLNDDRAEHVPGCNMAFWRSVLFEVGGCDPIYTAAGDDVDLCWKVLDRGWDIGFHPAALVWHHRRTGIRPYLRQQRGYGRAEALVEARHPARFSAIGGARWRGHIYLPHRPRPLQERIYRGLYGAAPFQSVYRGGGHTSDVLHQAGIPLAALVCASAPLAAWQLRWGLPALFAAIFILTLGVWDAWRAQPPRQHSHPLRFRAGVGAMHITQPLARSYGRLRHRNAARRDLPLLVTLPRRVAHPSRSVLLYPETRPRPELAADMVDVLRADGMTVIPATGWEDYDARLRPSLLVEGRLVTSAHPPGWVQVRIRTSVRWTSLTLLAASALALGAIDPRAAILVAAGGSADAARGWWRAGFGARRTLAAVER